MPARPRPAASAAAGPSAPWWRAGCRGCSRSRAAAVRNSSSRGHGMLATSPPETTTSRTPRRATQVVEHRRRAGRPACRANFSLSIDRRGVADEVHPGAVAAVLRAGRQQLGEHLGGVAVGEALGHPHVVLVQRVAGGVRVRGPVGTTVGEHREHVAADRVGVERLGQRARAARRRRAAPSCSSSAAAPASTSWPARPGRARGRRRTRSSTQVAEQRAQLPDVLDAVRALPLHGLPLLGGDVLPAREPGPVGLDELDAAVGVGLAGLRDRSTVSMLMACSVDATTSARRFVRRVPCMPRVRRESAACPTNRRKISRHTIDRIREDAVRDASQRQTRSACTGCSTPAGVLPQAAERLDTRRELWPDEVRIRVERLNLDAASFRQLERTPRRRRRRGPRARCSTSSRSRGKMQNPVTGSGGMLVGTVEEVGPELAARARGRRPGRHAGLADPDARWSSRTGWPAGTAAASRCPRDGYADPLRPLDRGRASPTTCPPSCRWR